MVPWQSNITWVPGSTTSSSRPVASVSAGSAPRGFPHTMPPGSRTKPPSSVTARIGFVEVTPGRALVPGRHGRADRRLVRFADATAAVAQTLLSAMRPGVRISELQAKGRDIYRREGVPDPAAAVIFFHGLGLSHMDIEQRTTDGKPHGVWGAEAGITFPVQFLYPGGEHERFWLEEVVAIGSDGGRPLFSWGVGALEGSAGSNLIWPGQGIAVPHKVEKFI